MCMRVFGIEASNRPTTIFRVERGYQGASMADEKKVAALISAHVQRYPEIDVSDVYKLLHQAILGPGHAIKNQKAAREWLERESELFAPNTEEPLIENIHPDG